VDADRFDSLTRNVASRRKALSAALGGVAVFGLLDNATARKRRQRRHRKPCKHFKVRYSCVDRCDTKFKTSTCGDYLRCRCQSGKTCLPNKTCGLSCGNSACPVDSGCTCSTSDPKVCLAPFTTCEDVPMSCDTTADCHFRFSCDDAPCGDNGAIEKRCRPICGHDPVL
jgi:hypothetical protein